MLPAHTERVRAVECAEVVALDVEHMANMSPSRWDTVRPDSKRAADTTFDDRSRGQVMADTLVERVTGRPSDVAEPVAVSVVISDETLLAGKNTPAVVNGYGPIPAAVPRRQVDGAVTDKRSRCTLRRLYRHPKSGALVAMESRSRCFPRGLAMFIGLRDQTCRTPY